MNSRTVEITDEELTKGKETAPLLPGREELKELVYRLVREVLEDMGLLNTD